MRRPYLPFIQVELMSHQADAYRVALAAPTLMAILQPSVVRVQYTMGLPEVSTGLDTSLDVVSSRPVSKLCLGEDSTLLCLPLYASRRRRYARQLRVFRPKAANGGSPCRRWGAVKVAVEVGVERLPLTRLMARLSMQESTHPPPNRLATPAPPSRSALPDACAHSMAQAAGRV